MSRYGDNVVVVALSARRDDKSKIYRRLPNAYLCFQRDTIAFTSVTLPTPTLFLSSIAAASRHAENCQR